MEAPTSYFLHFLSPGERMNLSTPGDHPSFLPLKTNIPTQRILSALLKNRLLGVFCTIWTLEPPSSSFAGTYQRSALRVLEFSRHTPARGCEITHLNRAGFKDPLKNYSSAWFEQNKQHLCAFSVSVSLCFWLWWRAGVWGGGGGGGVSCPPLSGW